MLIVMPLPFDYLSRRQIWKSFFDHKLAVVRVRTIEPHVFRKRQTHSSFQICLLEFKERQLFPLFDAAYLGFNSGNVDSDAFAIRLFIAIEPHVFRKRQTHSSFQICLLDK
jgi:hypothetical protein